MSTILCAETVSKTRGQLSELRLPVPSCPKLLFPHTYTFPSSVSPKEQFNPDSTLVILSFMSSSMRSVLNLPSLFPTPLILDVPSKKTFPFPSTRVVYWPEHDTCLTLETAILVGFTSAGIYFVVQEVPIFRKEVLTLLSPHKQASPDSVTAQMCSLPQLTFTTLSTVFTTLGKRTFKLGGWCPRMPFLFLPHVQSLPSAVTPADIAFPAAISTNRQFFNC